MNRRDEDDYARFVHVEWTPLFRTAYLMTGDYQLAEDLLQATFVKVYLSWPRISSMEQPSAYARRILMNQTFSWWRRRSSAELPVRFLEERPPSGLEDDFTDSYAIWNEVLALPTRERAVIVLRYYEDLTERQAAAVLGLPLGTVKSLARSATHRLAARLEDEREPQRRRTTA